MGKVHLSPPIDRAFFDYDHIIPDGKNSSFIGKGFAAPKRLVSSCYVQLDIILAVLIDRNHQ
jgi:hypothetical protein